MATKHNFGPLILLIILVPLANPIRTLHCGWHLSIDLTKYLKL